MWKNQMFLNQKLVPGMPPQGSRRVRGGCKEGASRIGRPGDAPRATALILIFKIYNNNQRPMEIGTRPYTRSYNALGQRPGEFRCLHHSINTFGIIIFPVSHSHLQKFDRLQREMLRRIIGWRKVKDESWQDTMSRMKKRLEAV